MISGSLRHVHFIGIVFTLLVLSILCQIMIGVLYQKLIRETDNMAATDDRRLKQCRLKFSNCYELNKGEINIPVFVDKFMAQIRFAGISLMNMTHLSGQLMLLSVFAAGLGVCVSIINGETLSGLLPYYIVSLFGLYVYFSVSSLVDVKSRTQMLRTNLIDYLENHLAKQLSQLKEKEMQPFINAKDKTQEGGQALFEEQKLFREDEQEELEQLLREFLA